MSEKLEEPIAAKTIAVVILVAESAAFAKEEEESSCGSNFDE